MTLETLLLLQRCLHSQQMQVGDPAFAATARQVLKALDELGRAIADAQAGSCQVCGRQPTLSPDDGGWYDVRPPAPGPHGIFCNDHRPDRTLTP